MQGSGAGRGGTGALQRRDLGLVEHSRDRLAGFGIEVVVLEAAEQWKGTGEKRHWLLMQRQAEAQKSMQRSRAIHQLQRVPSAPPLHLDRCSDQPFARERDQLLAVRS